MDRRDFLKLTASAGITTTLAIGTGCDEEGAPGQPPTDATVRHNRKNLLFILCDDLNDYLSGLNGHPQAYTPNIDRLRARGVTFTNAHANVPLCAPSRPSMLSGLLPSSTGQYHSTPRYFRDRPSLAAARLITQQLDENGYDVYITGKVAHEDGEIRNLFGGLSTWQREKRRGYLTSYGPYVWDGTTRPPDQITNPEFPVAIQSMYFGFGRLSRPPMHANGVAKWFYGNPSYIGIDGRNGGEYSYQSETQRSHVPDELSTNWIVDLMHGRPAHTYSGAAELWQTEALNPDKPFAIFCGLTSTHLPLYIPDKCFDDILSANGISSVDDIFLPELLPGDLARLQGDIAAMESQDQDLTDIPPLLKAVGGAVGRQGFQSMLEAGQSWPGGPVRLFKEYIHAYLAAVRMIDLQVGKMLDALEETGRIEDTMLIFTSDNGFSHLEKNWNFKHNLWSESTRIPLIIVDPELDVSADTETNAPVSLIDIFPTVIEACALTPVAVSDSQLPLDGESLLGLMQDPTKMRAPALSMLKVWPMPLADAVIHPDYAAASAITRYWRYSQSQRHLGDVAEELYNRRTDPNEWHNLADDPALLNVKKFLDRAMADQMICGGLKRTRRYADDPPAGFDPDSVA